ncbi:hypothetical protein L1987_87790 [Smallanthus sonchifolius]|nr:hypothetical protein L1987_87790 [Smallanthus sonchifolius]
MSRNGLRVVLIDTTSGDHMGPSPQTSLYLLFHPRLPRVHFSAVTGVAPAAVVMNTIRRAITAERKRLIKLSPTSILEQQHVYSSSTSRSTLRTLNSSKIRAPRTPEPPPSKPNPSLNDAVPKEPVTWPKPSEIPLQSKVVNSVNLIGRVKIPVQFEASSDGKSWAGTIIAQDDGSESSSSPTSFWIPVIFEGDMAHIAMCHLKEKDYVHVAGHLSVDVPPFKLSEVQANVQVMADSISFVQKSQSKKPFTLGELDRWTTKNSAISEDRVFAQQLSKEPDFIPMQQHTLSKKSTMDVAFEEENYAKLVNDAKSSPVHNSKETRHLHSDHKQSIHGSWRDLLTNPKQWLDKREDKRKGLVKANFPDFKHKDTHAGLWLDKAPVGVLQGLGQLEFFRPPNKDEKVKDGESWKHLIENPNKWWDNRVDKKNQKGPDFKNKDSACHL